MAGMIFQPNVCLLGLLALPVLAFKTKCSLELSKAANENFVSATRVVAIVQVCMPHHTSPVVVTMRALAVQVVGFYNSNDVEVARQTEMLLDALPQHLANSAASDFNVYGCRLNSVNSNQELTSAGAARNASGLFIHSIYDGNAEYVHPFRTAEALARFAALYVAIGDPAHVATFNTADDFYDSMDRSDSPLPSLVLFSSFSSPQSARMMPAFQAGSTLFKREVQFWEVRCQGRGSTVASAKFCEEHNVTNYPTLGLFTVSVRSKYHAMVAERARFLAVDSTVHPLLCRVPSGCHTVYQAGRSVTSTCFSSLTS